MLEFRPATPADLNAVVALYDTARREPYTAWTEAYPTRADAALDLDTGNLYVLCESTAGPARVIGALSVVPENETDDLPVWRITAPGVREIARVVVAPDCHGRGLAAHMMRAIADLLARSGCPALHIAVATTNPPALRTYSKVGFTPVGQAEIFEGEYVLMELGLSTPENP